MILLKIFYLHIGDLNPSVSAKILARLIPESAEYKLSQGPLLSQI